MCPATGFAREAKLSRRESHILFKHTHGVALLQINYQVILLRSLICSSQLHSQPFHNLRELSDCPPTDRCKEILEWITWKYKNF